MLKDTPWDKNLSVTCDGKGLIGHAGAVLLRKLADRCGLTAPLPGALARAGKFPQIDRGLSLVSMAVAIALGATSMRDIALLAHQALVFGTPPSDTTIRLSGRTGQCALRSQNANPAPRPKPGSTQSGSPAWAPPESSRPVPCITCVRLVQKRLQTCGQGGDKARNSSAIALARSPLPARTEFAAMHRRKA